MRYYFLELLACPICKYSPLILYTFEEVESSNVPEVNLVRCKEFCGYLRRSVKDVPISVCKECVKKEIISGILICPKCGHWYPIIEGIPYMLPDEYRDKKIDSAFIDKYFDKIPNNLKALMKIPDPKTLIKSP